MSERPDIELPPGDLLIAGERESATSEAPYEQRDPSTGEVLANVAMAGPDDVDRAVRSAREALVGWRSLPASRRRDVLLELARLLEVHAPDLSVLRSLETGAPYKKVGGGALAVEYTRYFAGWADKLEGRTLPSLGAPALDYTLAEPYGVVAALTPWNGGIVSAAMKVVPALVAGNAVVLKPSELAPLGPLRFGELCLEAGLPPGVLNVVPGGPAAGAALVSHPGIDKISFTGGTATARLVAAAAAQQLTPVILELGGKSANVVFADGDLAKAAMTSVMVGLSNLSGQGCVLPTRLLVEDTVYDQVEAHVVELSEAIRVGRPFDDGVTMGPVITEQSLERIMDVVAEAKDRGDGRLLVGGDRVGGELASGYFMSPTVFGDVDNASPLAQEEVFGPVLALVRFNGEDEALALANGTAYGLGAIVFTSDVSRAHRMAAAFEAGSVGINGFPPMPANAPFGGVKQSGYGREGGLAGVEEFLRPKNVYVAL
jgi:acyl-CoA reductase-like NAD-dependent aldehyde dehydrogenase